MATLDVTFINTADSAELDVELNDNMRSEEVIRSLIDAGFIPPLNDPTRSYMLAVKGRNNIAEGQTLANAGVRSQDKIRVSVTQRGGSLEEKQ